MKSVSLYKNDFLTIKTGNSALSESIERIMLTSPGERVNNPTFGCMLKSSIFDFSTYLTEDIIVNVTNAINKWEPRVNVLSVTIDQIDQQTFNASVNVQNVATQQVFSITTILTT